MATHFHPLAVKDTRRETADCLSVAFHIPDHLKQTFSFTQGQNITIRTVIDGEELRRSYSICSSPLEDELRIAVKKVPGGRFSAWIHQHLLKDAVLEVLPPTGNFYTALHAANKKHYMAFAAGSGITPLLSILHTALVTEPQSYCTLVYGNKDRASVIFREQLEALKNRFMDRFSIIYIFSREKADTPLNEGRVDGDKCDDIFRHLVNIHTCTDFFLCGPETMIFTLQQYLQEKGIDKTNIHFELFTVPGMQGVTGKASATTTEPGLRDKISSVTARLDGVSFNFNLSYDGEAILNAALATGADVPYACKGGVCASCRAKLLAGEVTMDNNYALEPEEIEKGYILTCQSHPRSEHVSIDFDV